MTPVIPDPVRFSAALIRKLIACQSVNGYLAYVTSPWDTIAQAIDSCPPDPQTRNLAFEAAIAHLSNPNQIRSDVFAADVTQKLDNLIYQDPTNTSDDDIPTLPASALVPNNLGVDACPWLDDYIHFSRQWAPRAFDDFHEAVAIWILSTIALRRVVADLGKQRFTNLYLALVAWTSLFTKTTVAEIGIQTIRSAGISWALADDLTTPQKFLADQADHTIVGYDALSPEGQAWAKLHSAFAGQRGWFYEEFGDQIRDMMSAGGFMADFRGILRRWDDTPEDYTYSTIGRGSNKISRPYLSLLANMTPEDLRPFARRGSPLWGDGFLARYALITPPEKATLSGRFPTGERTIPVNLIDPLHNWNQTLSIPNVFVKDIPGKDGKPSGLKKIEFIPIAPTRLSTAPDVIDAFYAYHDGLSSIIENNDKHDLDGNYARFAEKAYRVSLLLASVSGCTQIHINHWARAQEITEKWRAGLHRLYSQVNTHGISPEREKEEDVMRILKRLVTATPAEVSRYIRNLSTNEAGRILDGLVSSGVLKIAQTTQKGTKKYEIV